MAISGITPSFAYTQNTTPVAPENQQNQQVEEATEARRQQAVDERAAVRVDAENRTHDEPRSRAEERRPVDIVA
ncbi:MAG: hypothetical protein FD149_986 [Rhodospirillaceae bacterium]|nr:MAG: hypothetical protein FD149_986 [Rhodospirillaceae bacterium]